MTNEELSYMCILPMIGCFGCILVWIYGSQMFNHLRIVLLTIWAVDLLARYVNFIRLWYQVDMLTVYLLVWQLMLTVWKWITHELFSPVVIIEQGSFCVFLAILSFIFYDFFFRYIPFEINLLWFWFLSILDM